MCWSVVSKRNCSVLFRIDVALVGLLLCGALFCESLLHRRRGTFIQLHLAATRMVHGCRCKNLQTMRLQFLLCAMCNFFQVLWFTTCNGALLLNDTPTKPS